MTTHPIEAIFDYIIVGGGTAGCLLEKSAVDRSWPQR
jgi:glycerol-3-phosphate dehydrogenase